MVWWFTGSTGDNLCLGPVSPHSRFCASSVAVSQSEQSRHGDWFSHGHKAFSETRACHESTDGPME